MFKLITDNQALRNRGNHGVCERDHGGCDGRGGRSRRRGTRGHHGRSNGNQHDISRLQLTHVKVAFLPPNTTSHLQPLDAGIIASFKNYYKRKYVRHVLELFEEGKDISKEKINIKDAINYVSEAWSHVTEDTILNCWKKTGILPSSNNEEMNNAAQIQQEVRDHEATDINQMVDELNNIDSCAAPLVNALNGFFNDLEKEVPTEAILDENDIIKLIREEMDKTDENDESEEEPILVSLGNAIKSLTNWITFFEQQQSDEFRTEDMGLLQ
jgi:DDE superfamily endonuclease